MDLIVGAINATPFVRDLPVAGQACSVLVGAFLLAVTINVAAQLFLPAKPNAPPVVFHFVPIIGSAITYGIDPYKFFFTNRDKYGDVFTFKLLGRNMTVALGPKGSNLVFNGRLQHVSAEEAYTHLTTPVFGKEVVYDVPNAVLMEQKKMVKTGLSTDNFRVYVGQITDEVSNFIRDEQDFAALKQDKPVTIDIFKIMSEITILTASRTLQGKEVREGLNKTFADLYHDLDMGFNPINFVIPNLPLPSNFRRDRAQKKVSNFYRAIVQKRKEGQSGAEDSEHDMIASLMQQTYKNGRPLRDIEIAHIMIALLMAGQHTSSATMSWGMLRLASRPEIIDELYEEQKKVFGEPDGTFRPLDYDTQKANLPLMDNVIRETLRLHPPIHSIIRKVISDIPVPPTLASPSGAKAETSDKGAGNTYVIPSGHFVMAAPGVSQMDHKIWRDAERFDPHRWFDKDNVANTSDDKDEDVDYGWGAIKSGGNSPYLPFGAGRHRCIGEQFAYLQLGTILSYMVRRFDWRLESTFPGPDYTSMIVLPKKPANIVLTERKQS